jgi:hypothetical protein
MTFDNAATKFAKKIMFTYQTPQILPLNRPLLLSAVPSCDMICASGA